MDTRFCFLFCYFLLLKANAGFFKDVKRPGKLHIDMHWNHSYS